jgi:hypothetical protein
MHHQRGGDFECWLIDVLGDGELARQVHKLDSRKIGGESLRQALLELVINRYDELEDMM